MLQLMLKTAHTHSYHFSIDRYSFIQLSELEHCRVKKLAKAFNTAAQDSNPECSHSNSKWILCKFIKGKILYSAVSSPHDCSKHFTLYFPDRPVQSDTSSTSLGPSSHMLQLMREDCLYNYPPQSTASYSFI